MIKSILITIAAGFAAGCARRSARGTNSNSTNAIIGALNSKSGCSLIDRGFMEPPRRKFRRSKLERTFDLAPLGAPGGEPFLHVVDERKQSQRKKGEDQKIDQREGGIQAVVGLKNQIA